jgi:hypothetical protein
MRLSMGTASFDEELCGWVQAACRDWGWSEPGEQYYGSIIARLPEGLRSLLVSGLAQGLIIPHGSKFTLEGLPQGKGPYRWFSERRWEMVLNALISSETEQPVVASPYTRKLTSG